MKKEDFYNKWFSGNEIYEWNEKTRYYKKTIPILTKEEVKDAFTDKELLDMVDDNVIQNYLRNKKLIKIKERI